MQLEKLLALRQGHHRVVSAQLETLECENSDFEKRRLLGILTEKTDIIRALNEKIVNHNDIADIAEELFQGEQYIIQLDKKIGHLRESLGSHHSSHSDREETRTATETSEDTVNQEERSNNASGPAGTTSTRDQEYIGSSRTDHTHVSYTNSFSSNYHKLPKLQMPEFDGDVAEWQTFWDSYESTVHLNPTLSDVQKFTYLRSLIHGSASSAIAGFPLTNANYGNAIELLKQRFGQPHQIRANYMQSLIDLHRPDNSVVGLRTFHDKIETCIRGLESLGQHSDTYGDLLVPIIIEKLPGEVRRNLARERGGDADWSLEDLRSSIRKEIRIMETGQTNDKRVPSLPTASFHTGNGESHTGSRNKTLKQTYRVHPTRQSKSDREQIRTCIFCGSSHSVTNCDKVTDLKKRKDIVRVKGLCYNCFGKHRVSDCRSMNRCRHCRRKHHTAICEHQANYSLNPEAMPFQSESSGRPDTSALHGLHLHSADRPRPNVLLKTAVSAVSACQFTADANILFDEGSQRSFITQKLADDLQIQPKDTEQINLATFGGSSQTLRRLPATTVSLKTSGGEIIPIDVLIVPTIAAPLSNMPPEVTNLKYLKGLKLAHPVTQDSDFDISLLIGADHYWRIVQNRVVRGNGPTAVKSKIGYLLSGPLLKTSKQTQNSMLNVLTSPPDVADLEKFWKLESMGISQEEEKDTTNADRLASYQRTAITHSDGKYSVQLPWKLDHPPLPSNYDITLKRTQSTIRRLAKDPDTLSQYSSIIAEQEKRGFIEKVKDTDPSLNRVHYIPHHAVKKDSVTTPIRIVYDCSCRQYADSPCLNDCLESTPPEITDISDILVRFRKGRYAVSSDIEKAFLHIQLDEKDRDVTRFLWLSDPSDPNSPLCTYRFRAVLFGCTSSPFILNATLLKHLEDHDENWVCARIRKDLYVDNILSSLSEEDDAVNYFSTARTLMADAGFNLRSWNSNCERVRDQARAENVLDNDTVTKILGMQWNVQTDELSYQSKKIIVTDSATKREILQQTSRVYDPLGLLSPVTVRAKLLMQSLWKQKFDWDTPLPEDLQQKWAHLANDLNEVSGYTSFSRCYFDMDSEKEQNEEVLHIFVDASIQSYGAVAYLCKDDRSAIVMARNRVAPLKTITLPKLELMAAVIGARLASHLEKSLSPKKIFFWSDSQIVLHWLQSTKPLKRFQANRVKEIKELTHDRKWLYCPTADNPADLLTRGISAAQYKDNRLWREGPGWLLDTSKWPTWDINTTTLLLTTDDREPSQTSSTVHTPEPTTGIHSVVDITRYSRYTKLLRVTAYVLRFVNNCRRHHTTRKLSGLSVHELQEAEKALLKSCQLTSYPEEIANLQSKKGRLPLVKQLRLFLDSDGHIRCGGRIHNAPVAELAKFPYLLPGKHHLTRLIIQDAHERLLHAGVSATVTQLRQKYWIVSIRQNTKTVLRKCVTCKKVTGKSYTIPDPPPLPTYRLQDSDPFTVTGVDFTGALYVRDHAGKETKAYICLFTCASTRAIHLELVPDLSEYSFMLAFRRFCNRQSVPKKMISDNGATFQAAANTILNLFESITIQDHLAEKGTEWIFNPKRAPWYGGFWERLIGLTKTALKKVLGRSHVSYCELQTVITEIQATLNDRPLTYTSSENMDAEPLTPAHLLHGRRLTTLPYLQNPIDDNAVASITSDRSTLTRRARRQREIIDQFRERWKSEYLTALREHHKTTGRNQQTVKEGDVVQIHDDRPRSTWKLAVIQQLITGNDGLVRAARLKTQHGETTRPIARLYPLEVNTTCTFCGPE